MTSVFASGNTAVITGGAGGVGLAIAQKCVGHGMKVLIVDRDTELLRAAERDLGETVTGFELDVGQVEGWEKLKMVVTGSFGSWSTHR